MALERLPDFGSRPVALNVKLPPLAVTSDEDSIGIGIRDFYSREQFSDVMLVAAGAGATPGSAVRGLRAHRAVLAARSAVFREGLMSRHQVDGGIQEVRLAEVDNPEAVKLMLDFIYDAEVSVEYNPRTQAVNQDVLRLAQSFQLPGLEDIAARWLVKDLTTHNVLERLTVCETFGLAGVKDRILEQLTLNKKALSEISRSAAIRQHPDLMQALLQRAAETPEESASSPPQPKKKVARKK